MSDVPPASTPPAGWYPDPAEPSVLRYWDGAQWTIDMQPVHQPASDLPESRLTNRAAIGIVLALAAILTLLFVLLDGGDETGSTSAGSVSATQAEAVDADAKAQVRTAQTAIETFATDNNGQYGGATPEALQQIEPGLTDPLTVEAQAGTYTVTVESETGVLFSIVRDESSVATYPCTPAGESGCPESGDWVAG
jgi:hypothetical protein